jgi:hypothetical protein
MILKEGKWTKTNNVEILTTRRVVSDFTFFNKPIRKKLHITTGLCNSNVQEMLGR